MILTMTVKNRVYMKKIRKHGKWEIERDRDREKEKEREG